MEIKHQDILQSIINKDVSKRKDWEHSFIIKYKFCGSMRKYLLSMEDFKEKVDDEKIVGHVVICRDSEFHEIECLESEKQYGFYNSFNDIRPGHATWINKEDAEKLFKCFANHTKNKIEKKFAEAMKDEKEKEIK